MARKTPTREHAQGMLTALLRAHICGAPCNGFGTVGGQPRRLTCPYRGLNLDSPVDRRIIGSLYASAARSALRKAG